MTYKTARENQEAARARAVLEGYFERGKGQGRALFEQIKKLIITDYMVYTTDMRFAPGAERSRDPEYFTTLNGVEKSWTLHPHALRQMSAQVGIPTTFVKTLTTGEDWERRELSDLLTERFNKLDFKQRGGGKDRFLNRVVGNQVRGFVSRMYSRHISSAPVLEAFAIACNKYAAMPVSAVSTDLSFTLRCFLPYVFEPADGEFIGVGCSCSSSDFGAGTLRIGLSVIRVKSFTLSYVKDTHSERHLGKADNTADTSVELSQDTIQKQIDAKKSEVGDIVAATLHPDKVNDFLDTVSNAVEKKISWYQLERFLSGKLTKEEVEEIQTLLGKKDESGELPPVSQGTSGEAVANLWWASTVVSSIANKQPSEERKEDLQNVAGALLLLK